MKPVAKDIEADPLTDLELLQQPARSGMRICAWALWIVLVCLNYKWIIAAWYLAARAWPNLQ